MLYQPEEKGLRLSAMGLGPKRPFSGSAAWQDEGLETEADVAEEPAVEDETGPVVYLCKACRAKITTSAMRIAVHGKHAHICANPHGLVFEVGCFSLASGCLTVGAPTEEFTWFPGYAWCIALCLQCTAHLGWHYRSAQAGEFYGLILTNLVEDQPKSS
jgi:hypothetical protein